MYLQNFTKANLSFRFEKKPTAVVVFPWKNSIFLYVCHISNFPVDTTKNIMTVTGCFINTVKYKPHYIKINGSSFENSLF